MNNIKPYLLIIHLAAFISCAQDPYTQDESNRVQAPTLIKHSFQVEADIESNVTFFSEKVKDKVKISIHKNSLNREFLLQTSKLDQVPITRFSGMKSRIVIFKEVGKKLFMMEATQGHSVSSDLPQNLILASFPITKRNESHIYFDFNKGMSKLFTGEDWKGQDFSGSHYEDSHWNWVDLPVSYIESAEIGDHNQFVIRQIAQMNVNQSQSYEHAPVEIRYYLSPYSKNPNFQPTRTYRRDFDRVGFFEVSPQAVAGDDDSVIYASKFDISKPVTFYISANTPQEYRQAVFDGILYWNKAFKAKVLHAEVAADGISAPNYHHNIVQWVEWDNAGYAYADAQMDPRSGEILHAQVYLTSAFAVGGIKKARRQMRRYFDSLKHSSKEKAAINIRGFEGQHLCSRKMEHEWYQSISNLLKQQDLTDEILLKISQDYVREVVAHEMGHVLGLRHNFAGSHAANYPQNTKHGLFQQYIATGKAPNGIVSSSSVMEYQKFEESVMTGDDIAKGLSALVYDQKAINILYRGKELDKREMPIFCTDSHTESFLDCERFTSGSSPIEDRIHNEIEDWKNLPHMLFESFVAAKSKKNMQKYGYIAAGALNPKHISRQLLSHREFMLRFFKKKSPLLAINRQFEFISPLDRDQIEYKQNEWIKQEWLRWGGVESIFAKISPEVIRHAKASFKDLIARTDMQSGTSEDGEAYAFNHAELDYMSHYADEFFDRLGLELEKRELEILKAIDDLGDFDKILQLEKILADRMTEVLLSTNKGLSDVAMQEVSLEQAPIRMLSFKYDHSMRKSAAELLKKNTLEYSWGQPYKEQLIASLKKLLEEAAGMELSALKVGELEKAEISWLRQNQEILSILSQY